MRIKHEGSLYVTGPAVIEAIEGKMIIAGGEFERVIVPRGKGTSIRLPEGGEIEVELLEGGSIEASPKRPRPKERDEALEAIKDRKRIIVIGAVDVGKSFFSVLSINKLSVERFLDTDVGQGVVSPPTTIGLVKIEKNVPFLSYLSADYMYFVGSNTPEGFEPIFLEGTLKLSRLAQGKLLIDTTGRVSGKGEQLKVSKASLLEAKAVLIGELRNIARALEAHGIEYINIPPLEKVTARSKSVRREIRGSLYRKRLLERKLVEVPIERVYRYSEKLGEELRRDLRGLVVGLEKGGLCRGIGFVDEVGEKLRLVVSTEDFEYVRLGAIKIDPETLEDYQLRVFLIASIRASSSFRVDRERRYTSSLCLSSFTVV